MARALQTVKSIKSEVTDVTMPLGLAIFVRGPLRAHVGALMDLWSRVQAGLLGARLLHYRCGSQRSWTKLTDSNPAFQELFGVRDSRPGGRALELAEHGSDQSGTWLQLHDLSPVRGMERLSHIRVLFGSESASAAMAAVGEWAINYLPLWWGSGGFVFHHTVGSSFASHKRMAALAKRYWGVQIQNYATLQWEGLGGMPGINWLTLIGNEFAKSRDTTTEELALATTGLSKVGIAQRHGRYGLAVAAGPRPQYGDINAGEDLDAYVEVARLLTPLVLNSHTPLFGPFAKPDVLLAWLGRFGAPRAWLESSVSTE